MKRIFTIGAFVLAAGVVFAQQEVSKTDRYGDKINTELSQPESKMTPEQYKQFHERWEALSKNQNIKAGEVAGKVSFAELIANLPSTDMEGSYLSCWPDSLTQIEFTNSTNNAFNHGFGAIYDPVFNHVDGWYSLGGLDFSVDDQVVVDTIYMEGLYFKNQDAMDSLIFQVVTGPLQVSETGNGPFSGVQYNANQFPNIPAGVTATFRTMQYNGNTSHTTQGSLTDASVQRFAYSLESDSGATVAKVPVNITLAAGQGLGVLVTYQPEAGSYTPGDFISLVNRTGPNLWRTIVFSNTSDTDSSSYWLEYFEESKTNNNNYIFSETRYVAHTGTNLWRNDQTSANSNLGNLIYFHVSGNSTSIVGIDENDPSNIVLGDNYPNPYNGTTKIGYGVKHNTNVTFEVTDITGKVILSLNEGNKAAGTYQIELDGSAFKSGIYYYSITTGYGKATKKMIVLE